MLSFPVLNNSLFIFMCRVVVLYNSLAQNRSCLVTLFVDKAHLQVRDVNGAVVTAQISPQWKSSTEAHTDVYRVNVICGLHFSRSHMWHKIDL